MTSIGSPSQTFRRLVVLTALQLLAGCGDDSGGNDGGAITPTPPVANRAPVITSPSSVAVAENTSGTILQAAATDADGNALSYALTGGVDRARFAISATGALSFVTSPNFDLPTDTDENNDYDVQIGVSDGTVTTTASVIVSVTNLREGIAVTPLPNVVNLPVTLAPIGEAGFLVGFRPGGVHKVGAERDGAVEGVEHGTTVQVLAVTPTAEFTTNGRFFVMLIDSAKVFHIYSHYLYYSFARATFLFTSDEVFSQAAPNYAGGGWMGLDPDGRVIAALGDLDASSASGSRAQDLSSLFGKIIRISGYDPTITNRQTYSLTVLARGLRAPVSVVAYNGGYLVADRGGTVADEISFGASLTSSPNFGWPFKEGTRTVAAGAPDGVTDPVVEYARSASARVGRPIAGGAIGTSAIPALRDQFIFATTDGNIYTFPVSLIRPGTTLNASVIERRTADFAPSVGSLRNISDLRASASGRLLIADLNDKVFQVGNAP